MSSPQIRVAHVITRFHGAGGAKNTLFTCAGLDKTRFQVDLIVGASADAWRAQDAGVSWIQIPSLVRPIRPWQDARAARALLRLFREKNYHIVHTHLAKAGILGRWAAHRAGAPIVIHSLHGATFSPAHHPLTNALYLALERKAITWTDKVVSVGEDLTRRYLAAGVGAPDDYVIIHSGMDLQAFRAAGELSEAQREAKRRALGLPPGAFVAGYVAALEWRKGHRFLIRMMQTLAPRYPQLHLLFAGEGFSASRLKAMVTKAGLEHRIHFLGYRTDVAEILAAFHVKLFASNREGLPQVLVQANAVGVPILAFEAEGVRDMVRDGYNGYVFPYGDVAGMTAALERFIQNPDLARRMGQQGPSLVDDRWEIATMQRKTQALYDQLLQEKGLR